MKFDAIIFFIIIFEKNDELKNETVNFFFKAFLDINRPLVCQLCLQSKWH